MHSQEGFEDILGGAAVEIMRSELPGMSFEIVPPMEGFDIFGLIFKLSSEEWGVLLFVTIKL